MEEMVLQFFLTHGWKLTLLSCSGILFLGILKYFDVFKKLDATKKKAVYAVISACFSIAVCGVYLVVADKFTWGSFGILSAGVFGVNQSVYAVYENAGIRTLVRRLGNLFIGFVAKKQLASAKEKVTENQANDTVAEDLPDALPEAVEAAEVKTEVN